MFQNKFKIEEYPDILEYSKNIQKKVNPNIKGLLNGLIKRIDNSIPKKINKQVDKKKDITSKFLISRLDY